MKLEDTILKTMKMDEATWERHANPLSVWTRFTAMPSLIVAFWSRTWLGRWALVPVVASILWTWLNPRIFAKPTSTKNWASKSVLGERVWVNRTQVPIPEHHRLLPWLLNGISGVGGLFVIWGVARLRAWPTLFGAALVYLGKVWYLDRMVWLFEEMKDASPEYKAWLY